LCGGLIERCGGLAPPPERRRSVIDVHRTAAGAAAAVAAARVKSYGGPEMFGRLKCALSSSPTRCQIKTVARSLPDRIALCYPTHSGQCLLNRLIHKRATVLLT
jgi:hypothetical protein